MKGKVLYEEKSIGDWYKSYNDHYYVRTWMLIDDDFENTGKVDRWDVECHTPYVDMYDSARDYANVCELFDYKVNCLLKDKNMEINTVYGKYFDAFSAKNNILELFFAYENEKETFIDLYTKKNTDVSRDYANHLHMNCYHTVIDETFAWGRENNLI